MAETKEELLNGLRRKFGASRTGLIDDLRAHLTDEALTKPPALESDMPKIVITITLTPGPGGYAMMVDGQPADGVQADTVIDACLRAARYYEALQLQHAMKTTFLEVITQQHA